AGPQGEEVLEYAPVNDDARDQGRAHEDAGQADDVHADLRGVQVVVQREEEVTAQGVRQGRAGDRIEHGAAALPAAVLLPSQLPVGRGLGWRVYPVCVQRHADVVRQPVADLMCTGAGAVV